jgi:hypothetical protein
MKRAFWTLRLHDAKIVAGLLRSEGVTTFVFDDGIAQIDWLAASAYGGFRVMVADADAVRAAELVRAWQQGAFRYVDPDPDIDDRCPQCAGHEVVAAETRSGVALIIMVVTGKPLYWPSPRLRCETCAHSWQPAKRHDYATLARQAEQAERN